MSKQLNPRFLALLIFFLLATTLFNTMRANRVEQNTTTFRKETRRQLAETRRSLAEQKAVNVELRQQIEALRAAGAVAPEAG